MSLLHKAITLSGACAIGLTLAFAAPAAADDAKPINFRAVGGAVLGGTWNVGLTGVGKLVNDRYPGSAINVLQGASVSNPLRLEQNAADVTLTQTFNTVAARDGKAPYKKPLKNVASLANMNDTSRLSIIVSADLPVNTFDELMEKKLPVRLDRGAKGTLHNVVGAHAAGRIRVHLRRHHEMGRRTHRRFRQRPRGYVPGRHPERLPDPRPRPAVPTFRNSCSTPR